jgi:hypothetical protein
MALKVVPFFVLEFTVYSLQYPPHFPKTVYCELFTNNYYLKNVFALISVAIVESGP